MMRKFFASYYNKLRRPRAQFVIMLGDDGVLCVPFCIPALPIFAAHGAVEEEKALMDRVAQYPDLPITILIDSLAQDYRHETLPRLTWMDRRRVVARRLVEAFPHALVRASIQRDPTTSFMLAVHAHPLITSWIDRLHHRLPRLALLPYESACMLVRLVPESAKGWAMVLSVQQTGGVRQIVTRDGQLVFTRLTPPLSDDASVTENADTICRDLRATRGYLGRYGLADDLPLSIVAVVPAYLGDALRPAMATLDFLTMFTPHDAAMRLGLPVAKLQKAAHADVLHALWFVHNGACLPLWLPHLRKRWWMYQWNRALRMAALVSAFVAVCLVLLRLSAVGTALWVQNNIQQDVRWIDSALMQERQKIPQSHKVGRLRDALERQGFYTATVETPWPMLRTLVAGMKDNARLVKIDWRNVSGQKLDEECMMTLRVLSLGTQNNLHQYVQDIVSGMAAQNVAYQYSIIRMPSPMDGNAPVSGHGTDPDLSQMQTADIMVKGVQP